jgi:hypothetical protein
MILFRHLAVPLLLLAAVIAVFWRITLTNQFAWMDHPDMANQVLPWYQFQAAEWQQGRFPLWDPYHWGGQPLVGQAQPGAAYPLNWILFLLPLRDGFIRHGFMNWYFVAIHFMAALFTYLLCLDLSRSRPAALIAGLLFGAGGYMGNIGWPQMINGLVWAPVVFLFLLRVLRAQRPLSSAALAGMFLGIAYLSGHHQIPTFIACAAAGIWIFHIWRVDSPRRAAIFHLSVFAIVFLLTSAAQTWPAYEYWKVSLRWVGASEPVLWSQRVPYLVHDHYSLGPLSLLGIVVTDLSRNTDAFIGLVAMVLGLAGLILSWRAPGVRVMAVIGLAAVLFALGSYSVFNGIAYSLVPTVEKARNPSIAIVLFHLAVAVLAAFGVDAWRAAANRESEWARRLVRWTASVSLGGFALLLVFVTARPQAQGAEYDRIALRAFTGLLLAAILYAWTRQQVTGRAAVILLALLVLFEIGTAATVYYPVREQLKHLPKLTAYQDIVDFLRPRVGDGRVEIDREQLPFNVGDWNGIEQLNGYNGVTENVFRAAGDRVRGLNLLGTRFFVGVKPGNHNQTEIFQSASGLKVYHNPDAFPRQWTVHAATRIGSRSEVPAALNRPDFDPRRATFLSDTPPALESCEGDAISPVSRTPTRIVVDLDMRCRGILIVADTFFPGWRATVDGSRTKVWETYGFLRGVLVEAGKHRVEMVYRPSSVLWGAVLSLLGVVLGLGSPWAEKRSPGLGPGASLRGASDVLGHAAGDAISQ